MAGNVANPHTFANDVGPEALSLLDTNYAAAYAGLNTLSNFANYYVDAGAANALVVNIGTNQVCAALTDGLLIQLQVANTTTTTTPTLNVNGLGAKTIVTANNQPLPVGALVADQYAELIYDATNQVWRLLSTAAVASLLFASGTAALPGITFAADDTTGLYLPGAGQLGFSTGGVSRGTINASGQWTIPAPTTGAALALTGVANQYAETITGSSTSGQSFGVAIAAGTTSADVCLRLENQAGSANFLFAYGDGELTMAVPPAATNQGTLLQVGYMDLPQNLESSTTGYTLVFTDRGKHIFYSAGSGTPTLTIPANSSVAYPIGTVILVLNAGVALSIAITTDTLQWYPTGTTGTRTLAQFGVATLLKAGTTSWRIWGINLT